MLETENGKLIIRTPYNPEFVTRVKKLGGHWQKEQKYWTADPEKKDEIEALLKEVFEEPEESSGTNSKSAMTLKERIEAIIADNGAIYSGDTLERLVSFAYWFGRESATKEVSDAYRTLIRDMKRRAEKSRYQNLLKEVIGDKDYLLFPDYSGRKTKELGELQTDL